MIPNSVQDRADRLYKTRIAERREQLPHDIAQVRNEFARNGSLQSSMYCQAIHRVCEREIEIRGVLTWQLFVRAMSALRDDALLVSRNDAKRYVSERILQSAAEVAEELKKNLYSIMKPEQLPLDKARDHAIEKHDIEIDLYFDTLSGKQTEGSKPNGSTYNFYGNVSSVQTGDGATANVAQGLSASDLEVLIAALSQTKQALAETNGIAETKRSELLEIASDAEVALNSGNPNNTKLIAILNVLGTTMQSLASAQPAYQALKGALIPLGILLP